ncbi:hypothetical protein ACWOC1_06050 [Enterococcus quebecensis]|uniref:hypothetical protein n=1 Tax=Enterococcus quebecensis TaxID=903983 RepID=UPI00091D7CDD|nr:hypothetical protein [Enterococcus quebecensis]OJG74103.1 hypothetical protein RV12_GL002741 [Enterococcus quebecensis]
MKKEDQSLKVIPYQDIMDLQHTLDRLHSLEEPLAVLDHFFQFRKGAVNKKQVVKEYYACGYLFHDFMVNL